MPAKSEGGERRRRAADLRSRAALARRLANAVTRPEDQRSLQKFAEEEEAKAAELEESERQRKQD